MDTSGGRAWVGEAATLSGLQRGLQTGTWFRSLPLVVALATIATIAAHEASDPDLWWHLATGRYILAERRIPATDIFSFTAGGNRWVTHEWLSDVLLYLGYRLIGIGGLVALSALLIAAAFWLVYRRCRARPFVAAASVMLAAVASWMTWGVRPQMLSLFFSSLYLYILETTPEQGSRRLWLLAPLMLLWANLHSGFVSGLAIMAVFVVARELTWLSQRRGEGALIGKGVRQLVLVGLASLACSLVTPNSLAAALFPFGTLSNKLIQSNIHEWLSPDFHQPWFWPLAAYWLALLLISANSRERLGISRSLLLFGSGAAAMYSGRHVPFLSLVGAPVLAEQAEGLGAGGPREPRPHPTPSRWLRVGLGVALAALAVAIGACLYGVYDRAPQVEEKCYPARALAYMREHGLGGRIFNTYHWGGYLIWQGYSVFVDGRVELYGDRIFRQYLRTSDVRPDWEKPLQEHRVDVVLVETDTPLTVVLNESGRWRQVYRDELATVFVPANREARE